jgi:glycosyltransferase involved in cell wall biosynthesis
MKCHHIRISVIVPAHNVEKFIAATLDSLLRQTFPYFEVLVIDDGSTDGTARVVESYDDQRIFLIQHGKNQGLAAARNTGFHLARGEFIALLDADDLALPIRLAEQVAALEADPALGMVGSHVCVLDEEGRSKGVIWRRPVTPEDASIRMLFRNSFSAVMALRKTAIPAGGYRHLPMAEDYDFNMRVARHSKVMNLDKALTQIRVRHDGLTCTKPELMEMCVREVMREQIRELGFEATPHQLNLNRHVGALTMTSSLTLLKEVEAWLTKLCDANKKIKRYPEDAFQQVLAEEWFQVCKFASPLGLQALRIWHASPLSRSWQPTLYELSKFVTKCLLRHRRRGGDLPSLA